MPPVQPSRNTLRLRAVRRAVLRFFGSPFTLLAIVIAVIALANYKTLVAGLPKSVPELSRWWAEREAIQTTVNGSVSGTDLCWQMRLVFLNEAGEPILNETDYIARIGTARPSRTFDVPDLETHVVRVAVELTNADPDNGCLAIAGVAVMRAKTYQVTVTDLVEHPTITNSCTASGDTLDCNIELE